MTIEAERATAREALLAAEAAMKSGSRDERAFARAKRERQAALDALERLDWAEQAERERQEHDAAQARADNLREKQADARAAHAEAVKLAAEAAAAVEALAQMVTRLKALQERVNAGVHYESFAVRDRSMVGPTIEPRLRLDRDVVTLALRAGQELCMLAGMSRQVADQQASQQRRL